MFENLHCGQLVLLLFKQGSYQQFLEFLFLINLVNTQFLYLIFIEYKLLQNKYSFYLNNQQIL